MLGVKIRKLLSRLQKDPIEPELVLLACGVAAAAASARNLLADVPDRAQRRQLALLVSWERPVVSGAAKLSIGFEELSLLLQPVFGLLALSHLERQHGERCLHVEQVPANTQPVFDCLSVHCAQDFAAAGLSLGSPPPS